MNKAFNFLLNEDHSNPCQFNLARFYEEGIGTLKDIKRAEGLYLTLIHDGESQNRLARMYESGVTQIGQNGEEVEVIAKDVEKAKEFYRKAQDNGFASAKQDLDRLSSTL